MTTLEEALQMLRNIRENVQTDINDGGFRPIVKFNGGNPVVLCSLCRSIVEYNVNPETAVAKICPQGSGCGL